MDYMLLCSNRRPHVIHHKTIVSRFLAGARNARSAEDFDVAMTGAVFNHILHGILQDRKIEFNDAHNLTIINMDAGNDWDAPDSPWIGER